MKWQNILAVAVLSAAGLGVASAGPKTGVTVFDDIPGDAFLSMGAVWCSEGETMWADPVTPYCPEGGTLKLRDIELYSCFSAFDEDGAPEPGLSGTAWYSINGNFDLDYTGPVSGEFMVVPSPACDVELVLDPEPDVYWKGSWTGKRTYVCEGDDCKWVGNFKVVGKGHGGEIDGLQFRGTEEFITFTPLPIPWEMIPGWPYPFFGPEGVVTGVIF